ncbi:MAG: HpcH/HpaI aldolase/citrate lyase family protein [Cumulibacter sp.]
MSIATYRPRRSVLYMPSANARALDKAKALPADAIIFDLEDAVAPDAKEAAREAACAAVTSGEYGKRELTIRVNSLDTQWHAEDIKAVAAAGPDGIVVPKVNSADEVRQLVASLEVAGAPAKTKLWAMIETPIAFLNAYEIASASERLEVLVMGTNDQAKELHADHVLGRAPLLPGLGMALMAARAAGKVILDGVYNDVRDPEGFFAEAVQGKQLGFDGKTLIHPTQVEPTNEVFAPSEQEVADAGEIIQIWEDALRDGKGVATFNGKMIENLHVDNARRSLEISKAIDALQA